MPNMSVGNIGSLIGGIGSAASAAAGIASGIQGKNAAEEAARNQQQAVQALQSTGNQSSLLGLAQLDLSRQLADRQIEFANQYLAETQPFRDRALASPTTPAMSPVSINPLTMDPLSTSGLTLPNRTFSPVLYTQTPAERDAIEAQFRNARANTISNSPVRGGQLGSQLLDLEMGRANAVVGLESALARQNQALQNQAAQANFQAQLDADRFNATDAINARNLSFADQINTRNLNFQDAANARNFNAADLVNVRNANAQAGIVDRNLAAQIGFNAPGTALPALQGAASAFNPAAAGSIFNPALAAQGNAANVFGQNFASGNQLSGAGGQGLGSLAAAGKLANMKNGKGGSSSSGGGFLGKS